MGMLFLMFILAQQTDAESPWMINTIYVDNKCSPIFYSFFFSLPPASAVEVTQSVPSFCLSVFASVDPPVSVCGTGIVHHFSGTALRCASSTSWVHQEDLLPIGLWWGITKWHQSDERTMECTTWEMHRCWGVFMHLNHNRGGVKQVLSCNLSLG